MRRRASSRSEGAMSAADVGPRSSGRNVQHRRKRRREVAMQQGAGFREDAKRSEDAVRRLASAMSEGVAFVREGRIVWANEALAAMAARASAGDLVDLELSRLAADVGE